MTQVSSPFSFLPVHAENFEELQYIVCSEKLILYNTGVIVTLNTTFAKYRNMHIDSQDI